MSGRGDQFNARADGDEGGLSTEQAVRKSVWRVCSLFLPPECEKYLMILNTAAAARTESPRRAVAPAAQPIYTSLVPSHPIHQIFHPRVDLSQARPFLIRTSFLPYLSRRDLNASVFNCSLPVCSLLALTFPVFAETSRLGASTLTSSFRASALTSTFRALPLTSTLSVSALTSTFSVSTLTSTLSVSTLTSTLSASTLSLRSSQHSSKWSRGNCPRIYLLKKTLSFFLSPFSWWTGRFAVL